MTLLDFGAGGASRVEQVCMAGGMTLIVSHLRTPRTEYVSRKVC